MAPSLTDGVPGLEAVHTLVPSGAWSSFALNDWFDPSTQKMRQFASQSAFTMLDEIQGLRAKPDSDDPRYPLVYQFGETPQPRLQRGKTLVYTGTVYGQTMSAMRAHEAALASAAINGQDDPTASYMSVAYNPTYDTTGLTFVGYGVVTGYDCDEIQSAGAERVPSAFARDFTLTFRLSDGRWVLPGSVVGCGYSSLPPTFPGTWSGIASQSTGVLSMPGTAPADPVLQILGNGSNVSDTIIITNETTGSVLQLVLPYGMATNDRLTVDYRQRTVSYFIDATSETFDYSGFIDWANSDAWDETNAGGLAVGSNTLKVDNGSGGCPWAAYAWPAVW